MPMNESTRHVDLLKAFSHDHCPICHMVKRDLKRDMDTLMSERINLVDTHLAFRASRGLCSHHAHRASMSKGGSLGIAVMYESTMVEILKDIQPKSGFSWKKSGNVGEKVAQQLEPSAPCLICTTMDQTENSYLEIITQNLTDKALITAYERSKAGVCLPHFRLILARVTQQSTLDALIALQTDKWKALQADVQLFIKNNVDNIGAEQMGPERDSWQTITHYLSGDAEIFGLGRHQK